MLFCKWFTDESAVSRPAESSAARCSEQMPREATLRRESELALAEQYWRHLPTERQLSFFFFKKVPRFVSMSLLWKKSHQNVLKVAKYCVKARVWETWELMAAGGGYCCGPPQINELMGNTGGCLWECRQFSSRTDNTPTQRTQNEPYETCRARGDFPIVNQSQMLSLS